MHERRIESRIDFRFSDALPCGFRLIITTYCGYDFARRDFRHVISRIISRCAFGLSYIGFGNSHFRSRASHDRL